MARRVQVAGDSVTGQKVGKRHEGGEDGLHDLCEGSDASGRRQNWIYDQRSKVQSRAKQGHGATFVMIDGSMMNLSTWCVIMLPKRTEIQREAFASRSIRRYPTHIIATDKARQ
ncbi:hypothetical protein CONPUDRAFT_84562 [Coniophora puteana RWD-64-598 SS2]|uniref:Uncharacterized protein n=1 Tax=Coniophora puteana (strain RWD-64-598) TaxID=741705 RepID=A0A5M3MC24_CONPW|nr:uncharacterized protein CONPUDRAFT_84562 [Coniophora puteana RWD-64-598 SS2]EIW76576.1 hypothetical protein CONPUDRAFT_84562 [Coniophora puteana RWD-64-598 SS2]